VIKKAPAVIAGASKSKDVKLRRETMATTQETGIGFHFTDDLIGDLDVLESDHVQHLSFGPVWALRIAPLMGLVYAQ
jgi:hypothetical protein